MVCAFDGLSVLRGIHDICYFKNKKGVKIQNNQEQETLLFKKRKVRKEEEQQ